MACHPTLISHCAFRKQFKEAKLKLMSSELPTDASNALCAAVLLDSNAKLSSPPQLHSFSSQIWNPLEKKAGGPLCGSTFGAFTAEARVQSQ